MSEPLLAGEADEGSAAAGPAPLAEPAPWNQRNAVSYAAHMAWEQIRTVTPIALFLISIAIVTTCALFFIIRSWLCSSPVKATRLHRQIITLDTGHRLTLHSWSTPPPKN